MPHVYQIPWTFDGGVDVGETLRVKPMFNTQSEKKKKKSQDEIRHGAPL